VDGVRGIFLPAGAELQLAEIWMVDRQILANETNPMANRAVGVASQIRADRFSAR
jgi:hypothetical protein